MAKKIRQKKILTKEEREAERERKAEEQARNEAGIDDEFQAKGFEFAEWAQDNSHIVLGILGVIVLAGLATFVWTFMEERSGTAASLKFDEAHDAYNASLGDAPSFGGEEDTGLSYKDAKERATKSRELFQGVLKTHETSGAGQLAHLYIGQTSIQLEEWDTAAKAYQDFLASTSKADAFRFLAHDGLAIALEGKGDTEGAIKELEALIALPGTTFEDVALLKVARLYGKAGDKAKARGAAERIINEFKDSSVKSDAERLIASFGPAQKG